jgi:hypothetical protein
MYKRNVSEFLIKAVESNFISAHDYEYIVCSIVNYNHYDFKEGSAIGGYEVEEELDKYEDSYGLDVGGRAAWKRDMEKHQLILLIDSEGFRIKFEITLDELSQIWEGYDLTVLGKRLALGYIESYISTNDELSIEGLNAFIPCYGGLCYAEVTENDELLVFFDHVDFYIEHFFPNILTGVTGFLPFILPVGSETDLYSTYRCNCEWRLT